MEHTCWNSFCQLTPPNLMIGCASKTGENRHAHVSSSCKYTVYQCACLCTNVSERVQDQNLKVHSNIWNRLIVYCRLTISISFSSTHHVDTNWTTRLHQQPANTQNITKNILFCLNYPFIHPCNVQYLFFPFLECFFLLDQETLKKELSFLFLRM